MKRSVSMFMLALVPLIFSSCLKDSPLTDYVNIDPVVIIPNASWPRSSAFTEAQHTKISAIKDTTILLYARVSWEFALDKDVVITVAEAPGTVTDYNTKFGKDYIMIASDAFKLSTYKITVPAGKNDANIPFQVFGSKIDFNKNNMLSISITDASGQSIGSNYKTYMIPFRKI